MKQIIKDGVLNDSDYQVVDGEAQVEPHHILPLAAYRTAQSSGDSLDNVGLLLNPDDDVEQLNIDLSNIPVIALSFPAFSDGRSMSSAVIMRRHLNYQGELRAVGDVRVDQVEQMRRCGFDAIELAEGQDVSAALDRVRVFAQNYQNAMDETGILHRRSLGERL